MPTTKKAFFVHISIALLLRGAFMREPLSQTKAAKARHRQMRVTGTVLELKN
jgi:hypothetical protein